MSSAIGQTEAVKGGAGIGILHDFLAQSAPGLIAVLPQISIARSYWLVVHEDMRAIARVSVVADFIAQEVTAARAAFK